MPRAGKVERRILEPDPIYNSVLVTRFINRVMINGKKTIASDLVYKALENIEKSGKNPMTIFETAISNAAPKMEVRPRRVGGASYQIPQEVRGDRREALAIRWIIMAARSRSNESLRTSFVSQNKEYPAFSLKLAVELIDASEGKGIAIKKKEDMLKAAESNRAFAHFRF